MSKTLKGRVVNQDPNIYNGTRGGCTPHLVIELESVRDMDLLILQMASITERKVTITLEGDTGRSIKAGMIKLYPEQV